jgi:hypothetical protein
MKRHTRNLATFISFYQIICFGKCGYLQGSITPSSSHMSSSPKGYPSKNINKPNSTNILMRGTNELISKLIESYSSKQALSSSHMSSKGISPQIYRLLLHFVAVAGYTAPALLQIANGVMMNRIATMAFLLHIAHYRRQSTCLFGR